VEPLAVARAAARPGVPAGERCLVIGAGSKGLLLSMFLKANGVVLVVTDIHPGLRSAASSRYGRCVGLKVQVRALRPGGNSEIA
jgi:threonine dehydrogenase-like Zn-dependent dehydrogenase